MTFQIQFQRNIWIFLVKFILKAIFKHLLHKFNLSLIYLNI